MLKCKKVFTLLLSVLYFWLVSRKLCKGACMWILITVWIKQISHVRNVKLICQLFLAIVCNSYDWLKPLSTRWKYPLTSKSLRKLEISIKHEWENYRETTAPYLEKPNRHYALTKDNTSCTRNLFPLLRKILEPFIGFFLPRLSTENRSTQSLVRSSL